MTREEAIKYNKNLREYMRITDKNSEYKFLKENYEALDMAIKALEQEPCEDCVSRKEVIDIINFEDEWLFDAKNHNADTKIAFSAIKYNISELPSVTPRNDLATTSQDCISRQAVLDYAKDTCLDLDKYEDTEIFCDEIKAMPSVTPQPMTESEDKE